MYIMLSGVLVAIHSFIIYWIHFFGIPQHLDPFFIRPCQTIKMIILSFKNLFLLNWHTKYNNNQRSEWIKKNRQKLQVDKRKYYTICTKAVCWCVWENIWEIHVFEIFDLDFSLSLLLSSEFTLLNTDFDLINSY